MISVHIDGVRLVPGIDYAIGTSMISFSQPPGRGSYIEIATPNATVARMLGDGQTYLFDMDFDVEAHNELTNMLHDALKLRKNPAVAEALERLKVVVELVKQ